MNIKKILSVAKWEFLEKVKSKAFIIGIILTPLIIVVFSFAPAYLAGKDSESTQAVGILDTSMIYFNEIKNEIEKIKLQNGQPAYIIANLYKESVPLEELKNQADESVVKKKFDNYLLIKNAGTDSVALELRSSKAGNFKDARRFEKAFNKARINLKFSEEGIDRELASFLDKNIDVEPIKIDEKGESKSDFLTVFFTSFIFIILLMMMVIYSGQMLVRSLVEEKSSRLIEILVSSCTPNELMAGKIFGLSALGLSQVFIWILIGITLTGAAVIPPDAFANVLPMLFYFVLGFIFYTALFVGVGAIVTTEQEAQQVTSYVSLILILPTVFAISAIENPNSTIIQVMSYIPLTLPSIMLLKLNVLAVPEWEIILTSAIMIVSIFLGIYISAKIFRIGILSYGKTPSLKEIKNWIKE